MKMKREYRSRWHFVCENCVHFTGISHRKCCGHIESIESRSMLYLYPGICGFFEYETDRNLKESQSRRHIPLDEIMSWTEN